MGDTERCVDYIRGVPYIWPFDEPRVKIELPNRYYRMSQIADDTYVLNKAIEDRLFLAQ